ncbi:MAG: type II toxin-antitoxin system Phd/YefM family antitoxin [Parachlamydiaceae bacterium]
MRSTVKTRARKMRSISVTQARKDLGDIFGEVNYHKERIVLTNHKKRVAIVPFEDLELLEALEAAEDVREAKLALKEVEEKGSISLAEMKKRVG